jgi:hypothetical protein
MSLHNDHNADVTTRAQLASSLDVGQGPDTCTVPSADDDVPHITAGASPSRPTHRSSNPQWGLTASPNEFVVDPGSTSCSDGAAGTLAAPLCTVAAGVLKCRGFGGACTVALRGGQTTHRLNATISITPADSGLTIMAYPGDSPPVVSGAALLSPKWTLAPHPPPPMSASPPQPQPVGTAAAAAKCTLFNHTDCTGGFDLGTPSVASAEACMAACLADCRCAVGVWGDTGHGHTCYLKQVLPSRCQPLRCAVSAVPCDGTALAVAVWGETNLVYTFTGIHFVLLEGKKNSSQTD